MKVYFNDYCNIINISATMHFQQRTCTVYKLILPNNRYQYFTVREAAELFQLLYGGTIEIVDNVLAD